MTISSPIKVNPLVSEVEVVPTSWVKMQNALIFQLSAATVLQACFTAGKLSNW